MVLGFEPVSVGSLGFVPELVERGRISARSIVPHVFADFRWFDVDNILRSGCRVVDARLAKAIDEFERMRVGDAR